MRFENEMKIKAVAPWFGTGPESRVTVQASGCWEWRYAKNKKGYGRVGLPKTRKTVFAHRLAYEVLVGPIPKGLCLLHSCDNPSCCNPDHLRIGSKAENNKDIIERGRHVAGGTKTPKSRCKYERGEKHHAAKFRANDIRLIRIRYSSGECTQQELASEYGTSRDAIGKIIRKQRWAHVL